MQTHLQKVVARRDALAEQRVSCCCFFYGRGQGKELSFWNDVLGHFENVKANAGNTIKDSILYILDENSPNTQKFSTETKNLIKEISGREDRHENGERSLLLSGGSKKSDYWSRKDF